MFTMTKNSFTGYMKARRMLERRGFIQFSQNTQYYSLWAKNEKSLLVAYICTGEGKYFITIQKRNAQ